MLLQSKIADVDAKFAATRDELMAAKKNLEDVKNEKNELIRAEDRLLDSLRRKSSGSEKLARSGILTMLLLLTVTPFLSGKLETL